MRRYLVLLLLLWLLLSGLWLARQESLTTDEGIHIASGYLAVSRGEFRFDPEHPYLFKMVSSLPLFAMKLNLPDKDQELWQKAQPTYYDSWQEAREWSDLWFYQSGNNPNLMVFLGRLTAVLLTVLLGWFVYFLGCLWFTKKVGLYALLFTAFNPAILAHGHLANTDVPVALALLFTLFLLWRWLRQPSLINALIMGLGFGVALCTKHSAVSYIPVILAAFVYCKYIHRQRWLSIIGQLSLSILGAMAIIWLLYRFHSQLVTSPEPYQLNFQRIYDHTRNRGYNFDNLARIASYILPIDYLKGIFLTMTGVVSGRPAYLLDHAYSTGVWFYFPTLFVLKNQIIALIMLFFAFGVAMASGKRLLKDSKYFLIVTALAIYTVISMVNKLNLGIRHLMPLMPLIALILSLAMTKLECFSKVLFRRPYLLPSLVVILYIVPVIWQFPNMMGFSNIIVQPYAKAYLYYNDSNLDWGQQARYIAKTVKADYPQEKIYSNFQWNPDVLRYFGVNNLNFDPAVPPHDGIIVISATQLTYPEYLGFQAISPIKELGNHTLFYKLP